MTLSAHEQAQVRQCCFEDALITEDVKVALMDDRVERAYESDCDRLQTSESSGIEGETKARCHDSTSILLQWEATHTAQTSENENSWPPASQFSTAC